MNESIVTTSTSPAPLDLVELQKRCMGRVDLVEKLLLQVEDSLPRQVADLERAVQLGDSSQMKRIAHRLRGAALTISAHDLHRTAEKLESCDSHANSQEAAEYLSDFLRECERLTASLRDRQRGL